MKLGPIALCLVFALSFAFVSGGHLPRGEFFTAFGYLCLALLFASAIMLSCWQHQLEHTAEEDAMEIELQRLRNELREDRHP